MVSHENERLHRQEIAQNRVKTDLSQLCDRLWDTYELSYAGAQELGQNYPEAPFKESEADSQARSLREQIRGLGSVNVGAIEEYAQMSERYTSLNAQKEDLEKAKNDLQELIMQLLGQMETQFVSQFGIDAAVFLRDLPAAVRRRQRRRSP